MSDIFISYAREDRDHAKRLAEALEAQGWSVWWDVTIPAGKTFAEVIEQALGEASCVVVLWSRSSITSDWVLEEAEVGRKRGILVPVSIEHVTPPMGFRRLQAGDLTEWDGSQTSPAFQKLVDDISIILGPSPARTEAQRAQEEKVSLTDADRNDRAEEASRLPSVVKAKKKVEERPQRGVGRIPKWVYIAAATVVVLATLVYVVQWYGPYRLKREVGSKIAQIAHEINVLEQKATEPKKPDELVELVGLRDSLRERLEALENRAAAAGLVTRLEEIRNRLNAVKIEYTNSIGMKFVLIPEGTFMMGSGISPEEVVAKYGGKTEWFKDEHPQHKVTISQPFYLQTTEVTQGQWKRVMGDNPSHFKDCGDDCPVETVPWEQAHKFIKELNKPEGTDKYRLPTEAEWEYACRVGSTGAFCFGDSADRLSDYAWYRENSQDKTHPVARKKPNAWGLYDMHGNVLEWCQDWYGAYPPGDVPDPKGPSGGDKRVLRGGSFYFFEYLVRCACRYWYFPVLGNWDIGIRVVLSP